MNIRIQIVGGTKEESEALHWAMQEMLTKVVTLALDSKDVALREELLRAPISRESNNTEQLLVLANSLRECNGRSKIDAVEHLKVQLPGLLTADCHEFLTAAWDLVADNA